MVKLITNGDLHGKAISLSAAETIDESYHKDTYLHMYLTSFACAIHRWIWGGKN